MSLSYTAVALHGRTQEIPTLAPCKGHVSGRIPSWLNGDLLRNGPGIQKIGNDTYNNLIDGLSVLHKFRIRNGEVTYITRPLESDTYKKNMAAERIMVTEVGTVGFSDPCESIFKKFQSKFYALTDPEYGMTDNCNVNFGFFGDEVYALTEASSIRKIDPVTLETVGEKLRLGDFIAVNVATAHPHQLPDGAVINMGNNYKHRKGPHYCIIKIPGSSVKGSCFEDAEIIAEIPASNKLKPSYYHSFGLTENYIIFMECPVQIDILQMVKLKLMGEPPVKGLKWNDGMMTRFHVVSLKTGKPLPVTYLAEPVFAFHHINAYEEDGHIVFDIAAYSDSKGIETMSQVGSEEVLAIAKGNGTAARRYCLPLEVKYAVPGSNLVTLPEVSASCYLDTQSWGYVVWCYPEFLTDGYIDLPRINYAFNRKKYEYFYGMAQSEIDPVEGVLVPFELTKVNVKSRERKIWYEEDTIAGEPVFVANPNGDAADEDDGVILSSLIHLSDERRISLLVLDAKTMKEIGRATFETAGVSVGAFHGQWVSAGIV